MLLATKCYGKLPNRFSLLLLLFFHMFIDFFPQTILSHKVKVNYMHFIKLAETKWGDRT